MNLEPADTIQCQAEKPNGHNAFTLGGVPGLVRCVEVPAVTIKEKNPAEDGMMGEMSLCADCLDVFNSQSGTPDVYVTVIR